MTPKQRIKQIFLDDPVVGVSLIPILDRFEHMDDEIYVLIARALIDAHGAGLDKSLLKDAYALDGVGK